MRKRVCKNLNYIAHLLVLASAVNGCVSISAFASSVGIPAVIAISAVGIKIFEIISVIKKYNK